MPHDPEFNEKNSTNDTIVTFRTRNDLKPTLRSEELTHRVILPGDMYDYALGAFSPLVGRFVGGVTINPPREMSLDLWRAAVLNSETEASFEDWRRGNG